MARAQAPSPCGVSRQAMTNLAQASPEIRGQGRRHAAFAAECRPRKSTSVAGSPAGDAG